MGEASTALEVIRARASEYVAQVLGPPDGEERPRDRYAIAYSARWQRPPDFDPSRWNDAWFDWGTGSMNREVGMSGVYVYAGLSIDKPGAFDAGAAPDWQADLERGVPAPNGAAGEPVVFRSWPGARARRLRRVALPQDVVRGSTLEAQGDSVGRWVEETYRALLAHGAPR